MDVTDHDEGKPRATVRHYAAYIGRHVMANLAGLASARCGKRPRAYQTDAEIHQRYIIATSGGADGAEDAPDEGMGANAAPTPAGGEFLGLPYHFDQEEMRDILDFKHKLRPSANLKELLDLPCMQQDMESLGIRKEEERRRGEARIERAQYRDLAEAPVHEKRGKQQAQEEALDVNAAEDHIDEKEPPRRIVGKQPRAIVPSFAKDGLYEKPAASSQL